MIKTILPYYLFSHSFALPIKALRRASGLKSYNSCHASIHLSMKAMASKSLP